MFAMRFPSSEIEKWSSRYEYGGDEGIAKVIVPRVKAVGYLTKRDFVVVCSWKSPRRRKFCESNPEDFIREATSIAFSTKHEPLRIGTLNLLAGVKWPTASAILHFCHRDAYPILDFRALWSLGIDKRPNYYDFNFWWEYVQFCRTLAKRSDVAMRTLDRALWQYSKENQPALSDEG